jgi:hypothetical protein
MTQSLCYEYDQSQLEGWEECRRGTLTLLSVGVILQHHVP